jgi:hypothetical protein
MSDEDRARDLVAKLARHDFSAAVATFDEKMRAAMPEAKVAEVWSAIEQQAGAFERVDSVAVKQTGDLRVALTEVSFARAPLVVRVVLAADGRVTGLFVAPGNTAKNWQPPDYAKTDAFEETGVTVASLPGTLTIPKNAHACAAVVLVHGSGPNDRDETIGPNKPFKDLAWGLASRGIVVLRYDKRTRVNPIGIRTQKDEVDDAAHAAVALLRARPEVDPARVALLGHSQGGYLAPRIAREDPAIRRLVILAGPTRPLEDSLVAQTRYVATLPGHEAMKDQLAAVEKLKATVESPTLRPDQPLSVFGASISGAYFLDVRGYHPADVAAKLTIPILVLQGERDYQVTMDDFAGWRALRHATLKSYPGLNHLFMRGEGPPSPSDYEKAAHVDAAVVADIAAFVSHL